MNNAAQLRADLSALGWSAQRLADWLTETTGDKIAQHTVQRWLTDQPWGRACPGWPAALLRCHGYITDTTKVE